MFARQGCGEMRGRRSRVGCSVGDIRNERESFGVWSDGRVFERIEKALSVISGEVRHLVVGSITVCLKEV